MKTVIQKIKLERSWHLTSLALLILMVLLLIAGNYTPANTLLGWDNLPLHLNNAANFDRALFSSWQEFEGLGTTGGLAYATTLPLSITSIALAGLVSSELVRMVIMGLTLWIGAAGMYVLVAHLLKAHQNLQSRIVSVGALIAAVFYMVNLATVQAFYVPLELFAFHFAALPWIYFAFLTYLTYGSSERLLALFLGIVFFAHQAFNPTMFFALSIGILLLFIYYLVGSRGVEVDQPLGFGLRLKRTLVAGIVYILANAFWLPAILRYLFIIGPQTQQARINEFASDVAFLQNQEYGTFLDIVQLKGFWFGNQDLTFGGQFTDLLGEWVPHMQLGVVNFLSVLIFILVLAGIAFAWRNQRWMALWLVTMMITGFLFLGAGNPPLGFIFDFLRQNVPLLAEALRFPFTKFSLVQGFIYALGLGYAVAASGQLIDKLEIAAVLKYLVNVLPFAFIITIVSFPAFQGFFISGSMQVPFPQSYQQFFRYMNGQPAEQRLMLMPVHTHWGWYYHRWGYQGSGFLWYGIEQPVVSRTFDVWSPHNEQLFREFQYAYYAGDYDLLETTLAKYNISWLLWDESMFIPGGYRQEDIFNKPKLQNWAVESPHLELAEVFGEELELYRFTHPRHQDANVQGVSEIVTVAETDHWITIDPLAQRNTVQVPRSAQVAAPFRTIVPIDQRFEFEIDEKNKYLRYQPTEDYRYLLSPTDQQYLLRMANRDNQLLVDVSLQNSGGEITPLADYQFELPLADFSVVANNELLGQVQLPELDAQLQDVGRLLINEQASLSVRLYENFELNAQRLTTSELDFSNCDASRQSGEVDSTELDSGELRVYADDASACATKLVGSRVLADRSMLAEVEFSYRNSDGGLNFCFSRGDGCISEQFTLPRTKGEEWEQAQYSVQLAFVDDLTGLTVSVIDVLEDDAAVFADISDISIRYQQLVADEQLDLATVSDISSKLYDIEFYQGQALETSLITVYADDLNNTDLVAQDTGCFDAEAFSPQTDGDREYLQIDVDQQRVCLGTNLLELDTSESYLVAFDVLHQQGRAPEICILDLASNLCTYLEQVQIATGEWLRHYAILPAQYADSGSGYRLLLQNWAPAASSLRVGYDNLRVYRFAEREFYSYRLGQSLTDMFGSDEVAEVDYTRYNPVTYRAREIDTNYLALMQGYDPGWVLLTGDESIVEIITAAITDDSSLSSYRFRGWANLWSVPTDAESVTIYYAPQLLQWIGYAATGSTAMLLLLWVTARAQTRLYPRKRD